MTSNQIAYATQQETARHNLVSEQNEKESLRISEDRNNLQREYNQQMADIQRRYNDTYLEMQKAQGDRKLDLQKELNDIEWEKTNAESYYKQNSVVNMQATAELRSQELKEQQRYHDQLKDLGYTDAAIKYYEAMVKNKSAEYQKYYNDEMVRIQDYNALSTRQNVQNQWQLGLLNVENQSVSNEIRNEELQERKKLWDVEKGTMITGQVFQGLNTVKGFIPGINLFSK